MLRSRLPLELGPGLFVFCPKPVCSVFSDGAVGENRNPMLVERQVPEDSGWGHLLSVCYIPMMCQAPVLSPRDTEVNRADIPAVMVVCLLLFFTHSSSELLSDCCMPGTELAIGNVKY